MNKTILDRAIELAPTLVRVRRTLHRHPELGFQEHRTAALVADTLRSWGIRVDEGVGKTGVVGHIGLEGPIVALRADMDALPIQELNETDYSSQVPGVMHACGHDAHTACLLGAARLLSEEERFRRGAPPGQVRLLFQPAEEGMDEEGKSGAMRMVDDGALEGVEAVFGLHVDNKHAAGKLALAPGFVAAAMDSLEITILGTASHGAQAYLGVDAVLLAAQVVSTVHTIVSRRIPALESGVISVGTVHGGTKENILAETVELRGTLRSFDPEVRQTLIQELERACTIARTLGGDYRLAIRPGYPALYNDPALTAYAQGVLQDLVGADSLRTLEPEMGSEDFSFFAQRAPGCYFSVGTGAPGQAMRPAHHPRFGIDESALPVAAAALTQLALGYLDSR